jgi:hypothetical protein
MVQRSLVVSLLLLTSSNALACNPAQGTGQCGYQGYGGIYSSYGEAQDSYKQQYGTTYNPPSPPPPPRIVMLPDSWGAIAVNSTTFASTYNMSSKKEARQKALKDCQYRQKEPCVIYGDYANRCVSLVQGWDKNRRQSYFVLAQSTGRGQIGRGALNKCAAQYNDCRFVIEEECSLPQIP